MSYTKYFFAKDTSISVKSFLLLTIDEARVALEELKEAIKNAENNEAIKNRPNEGDFVWSPHYKAYGKVINTYSDYCLLRFTPNGFIVSFSYSDIEKAA